MLTLNPGQRETDSQSKLDTALNTPIHPGRQRATVGAITGMALSLLALAGCEPEPNKQQITETLGQPVVKRVDIDMAIAALIAEKLGKGSSQQSVNYDSTLKLAAAHAHSSGKSVDEIVADYHKAAVVVGDVPAAQAVYDAATNPMSIPSMEDLAARMKELLGKPRMDAAAAQTLALETFKREKTVDEVYKFFSYLMQGGRYTPSAAAWMVVDANGRYAENP